MLQILKDIKERAIILSKGQADLQTDIREIKSGQQAIETKLVDIFGRLECLESKSEAIEQMSDDLAAVSDAAERLMSQQDVLQSRQGSETSYTLHGTRYSIEAPDKPLVFGGGTKNMAACCRHALENAILMRTEKPSG